MRLFETLKFLLTLLDFPSSKLEDNLPLFLKCLNYLFKLNKSTLRSPVPHLWPTFLTLIHCLDHIAKFHIHLSSSPKQNNSFYQYTINNYMQKISVFCALTRCELQILERIRCRLDNMKRRPIYILPKEINQLPSRIIRT